MSGDIPWYLSPPAWIGGQAVVVTESKHLDDGCSGCGVAVVVGIDSSCSVRYGF